MAKLSSEEVVHIAKLSRLELFDKEIGKYQEQLSSVLEYVEKLDSVDTSKVDPTANVTGLSNIYREDVVASENIDYSGIEQNAPEFKNGFFVVPGVFE